MSTTCDTAPERKHSIICSIPDLEVCSGLCNRGGSPISVEFTETEHISGYIKPAKYKV